MANSPAQEAKNAAKGVGDAAALAKRFGQGGDISIEQDPYGNFRLSQNQSGKTVRVYFVPAANGTDFSIATESQIIQLYKKNATQAGGLKALRKKLYELGFISKPDYTREDEASFNNAIIEAANSHSMEQIQKYTLNPGQKSYKFDSFAGWLGTKKSGLTPDEPQLPQRNVEPLERAAIYDFVDSIYLSKIGQLATNEEKKKHFAEFEAMNTGTVTTTKKVKNPKTGVLENVSTTTRGFNQDAAQAKIEADIKKNNPLEYQRRKAFQFADEATKIMSGGM